MYRTIDASFWTDPKVKKLDAQGKLFLLYLITNPHSHVSGIYVIPWLYIQSETKISLKSLDTLSNTLSDLGIVGFDRENDVVFVVNMLRYQGRGEKNLRSAANQLRSIHKTYLINEFVKVYPPVSQFFVDTVSIPYPELAFRSGSGTDQKQEQKGDTPASPDSKTYGEFGLVRLTDEEFLKLKNRLNYHLDDVIARLDRWGKNKPRDFKKNTSHYATILNWYDRDVKQGKIGTGTNGKREYTEAERAAAREEMRRDGIIQ